MALKIVDIGQQVTAIIRKQSKKTVDKYMDRWKDNLALIAVKWRREVRDALSVQVPKPWGPMTPRNMGQFPKRRTGDLQRSILLPNIQWKYRSKRFVKAHGKASIEFTVSNFFGKIAGQGYGETLNRMKESTNVGVDANGVPIPNTRKGVKPFAGWKERAMRIFYTSIEHRRTF